MTKHTFVTSINTESMQRTQSHRSKQKAGVEDKGRITVVALGKDSKESGAKIATVKKI